MRLLEKTNIDFLAKKGPAIAISVALILIGAASVAMKGGLNLGIDFTGGTQIVYGFNKAPDENEIRKIVENAKPPSETSPPLKVDSVQRFDKPEKNQVLLRVRQDKEGRDVSGEITKALTQALYPSGADAFDLNLNGADALQTLFMTNDPEKLGERPNADPKVEYARIAASLISARSQKVLFPSVDDAVTAAGVSPAVGTLLKEKTVTGPFTLLNAETVGPQVGKDLRERGMWAIILSWVAMLLYIALRFRKWSFGVAAVVALIHDSLVTLGFCSLLNVEISLTVVASFLTLIGYSVNDTVVIFDRIRENLQKSKKEPLPELINRSVNETLSRTLLTTILTFLVVVALFFFGGEVIHGFAFVLLVGLIVGSYSTIFIASPVVIWWEAWRAGREGNGPSTSSAAPRTATAKAR